EDTFSPWRNRRSNSICHGNGSCPGSRPSAPRSQSSACASSVVTTDANASLLIITLPVPTARLFVEPLVEFGTMSAPLALECRNLAGLRHCVGDRLRELGQSGNLPGRRDLVRH